jgi:Transglutaminase-like superfamily
LAAVTDRGRVRLSWLDWWTFGEAVVWLALARVAILVMRFPELSRRLGRHMVESTQEDDDRRRPVVRRVRWAIGAVSRRAPWRCKCLEQAVAAKLMLRRRGMASTLYLGVARDPGSTSVQAHAWLRCGSYYVTGGEDRERYAVVSTFAEESAG